MKNFLGIRKLTTKDVCTLGLLIAITVVLSIVSGYIRIGLDGKISLSFVSVFVAGALFGPLFGGVVGAMADIISCFVNPVGAFLPQLTLIEFMYGFIFGVFFYKRDEKFYIPSVLVCDIFVLVVNALLKTIILCPIVGREFVPELIIRLPICLVQSAIILVVLLFIKPFLKKFR